MGIRLVITVALAIFLGSSSGCGSEKQQAGDVKREVKPATPTTAAALTLASPAFKDGEAIPIRHTCDGADLSPELKWNDPPAGTVAWALVCHDPDAPAGDWVHWVIYDIPGELRGLPEGLPDSPELEFGAKQGKTDFGRPGYGGPCPPPGKKHHYLFELYALKEPSGLKAGATREQLMNAIRDKVITQAILTGTYKR